VAYTFLVIIATVLLQSLTARPLTRALGLDEAEPTGLLILGANPVARAVGKSLKEQGFRVKLADTSWEEIRAARMSGLETYYGDPLSSHAEQSLELIGIGRLLAMSRRPRWNTLACLKYRSEFGAQRVFSLRNAEEQTRSERERPAEEFRAPALFGEQLSYQKLASLLAGGASLKTVKLGENFSLAQWQEENQQRVLPLFAIDGQGRLQLYTDQQQPEPDSGLRLTALVWKVQDKPAQDAVRKQNTAEE
jgi:Trk K+ transport system NAD-binding subunit